MKYNFVDHLSHTKTKPEPKNYPPYLVSLSANEGEMEDDIKTRLSYL